MSHASVGRIRQEELAKLNSESPRSLKKRVQKSPLTIDIVILMLTLLEKNSQLTLKEMVVILDEKGIETSTSALNRALHRIKITWKNVTPIPLA